MTAKDQKILTIVLLIVLVFVALIFYGRLTSEESLSSDVTKDFKEAQRLLSSGLNITYRNQAISARLNQLRTKFLISGDPDQAEVRLLQEVERIANSAGLVIAKKNISGDSKDIIGVNLEGTTVPDNFFRFLQKVTEGRIALQVRRLQLHVLPDSKLLSYQITLTTLLIDQIEAEP